jgi:hypothetical protein
MSQAGHKCRHAAEVAVVWAFDGALNFPSVYYFCEFCADQVCVVMEVGTWTDGMLPAYLEVVEYTGPRRMCAAMLKSSSLW